DEIKLHKVAAIASVFQPEISMEHHSFNKHLQKGKSYVGRPSDYAIIGNY
ncbi:MAG: hypothetical protein HRT87_12745, partial [Legionellales bacterium]|nr:hypothetical protein [Legionellales bacterium]